MCVHFQSFIHQLSRESIRSVQGKAKVNGIGYRRISDTPSKQETVPTSLSRTKSKENKATARDFFDKYLLIYIKHIDKIY